MPRAWAQSLEWQRHLQSHIGPSDGCAWSLEKMRTPGEIGPETRLKHDKPGHRSDDRMTGLYPNFCTWRLSA
jgi:hypothetical protein